MLKFTHYFKNYKKEFILGPLFKLIEAIFDLVIPLVMAKIIDIGIPNSDIAYICKMGGLMLLLGILGMLFAFTAQYFAAKASQGFGTDIRNDLFRHINTLSHSNIDTLGTPSLITRITNDVNNMQIAVAMFIRLFARAPFIIIGSTAMAATINFKMSLIFFITIPIIAITLYLIMSKSIPYYSTIQRKLDKISLITRENLEGVRIIRAFSKQKKEEHRFEDSCGDLMNESIRVGKIAALLNPITYCITNFAVVAIIWIGGLQVNNGALTPGQIIAFVNYMSQILITLIVIANLVVIFTKASACAQRVNEVFETQPSITEFETNTVNIENKKEIPKIEFQNVSFSYPNSSENSLTHISFKIYSGETIGIIGGTGSGKSTLINLIPRFYDAVEGNILIDGKSVKDYSFTQLRSQIGLVPQKAVLFTGTLRENICWGLKSATTDQIENSLKIAQASNFISELPEKYETPILQSGKNLSGGQKQRLTIARALVRNPKILILDDSSSALDYATDSALRKALQAYTNNTTVIMVSQRASSIKHADKIIVLDDGELVGIGSHSQLFKDCTVYQEICLSQLGSEEVLTQ